MLKALILAVTLLLVPTAASAAVIPSRALQYRRPLIANAHFVWGLNAPIAILAGQLHQESSWRATAQSPFASGLAQFTPATAAWAAKQWPDLNPPDVFNPSWALRAQSRYDKFLYDRQASAATDCDRWAFTLSGYNGGEGWVSRDKRLTLSKGFDPAKWWGNVERFSSRASWAFKENRNYPKRIIFTLQPIYNSWGPEVSCSAS